MKIIKPFLIRIRCFLIPPGSHREGWYYLFRYILLQRRLGWKAFLRKSIQAGSIRLEMLLKGRDLSPEEFQYQVWLKEHEPTHPPVDAQQARSDEISRLSYSLFLLDVPSARQYLERTIQSILSQSYLNWEILVMTSTPSESSCLESLTKRDHRIRLVLPPIEGDSGYDLKQVQGDYILILRSGDTISPYLLQEVTLQLQADPLLDVIYTDEDQIDPQSGCRFSPWFKPSRWSPDLLISVNYLRHAAIRKTLLDNAVIPFSFNEFQEWELLLRVTERPMKMAHIAKVLYHQAQTEQIEKLAANLEWRGWMGRAIESHLSRRGITDTRVTMQSNAIVCVLYPTKNALASIIIPSKNRLSYVKPCISSILEKTRYPNFEILLIDNQSDDPDVHTYYESLSSDRRIKILSYPYLFNFHALNNWAVGHANGDVLIFLNNDTEVLEPDWLEQLVGIAMRADVGVVGAKLLRPNGLIQHVGMIIGLMGHAADIFEDCEDHTQTCFGCVDWYRNYRAVTGACMAIRREVFDRLKGFDEVYEIGYGDIDLCLRAHELGYHIVYTPFVVLKHHEGGTRELWLPRSDILRATQKMWSAVAQGDDYFNPNLSYHSRKPIYTTLNEESRTARLLRILQEFSLVEGGAPLQPPEISLPYED